jgi:hypothetical protein
MSQTLLFDPRYAFDIFTEFPRDQAFPFQPGQTLWVPVFILPHPPNEAVRQDISSNLIWYASVYPLGLPDPSDPFQETILIELAASETPEQTWTFAWRVDHHTHLVSFLEDDAAVSLLPLTVDGKQDQALILMEVSSRQRLEEDFEQGITVWRMILKPHGEERDNRIKGTLRWLPVE